MTKTVLTFLALIVTLSVAKPVLASDAFESEDGGNGYFDAEQEQTFGEEEDGANHPPLRARWFCYSRYVGPYGWGSYYGWAYNYPAAFNNAIGLCRLDHRLDPGNCIVTGCQIR